MTNQEEKVMYELKPTEGITGVNKHLGIAMLRHEIPLPITNWLDSNGNECSPKEACVCVAGDDKYGWWSIDLSHYSRTAFN